MIARVLGLIALAWALGFVLFVIALPRPAAASRTDAIVVPTGGPGRIARGLALLEQGQAKRMLVSGVDRRVRAPELAQVVGVSPALLDCCVDLGREAVDTRSNGEETARWVKRRKYRSLRLVTTDWHMRRAQFELEQALGDDVAILPDAIRSEAPLSVMLYEYNKLVLRGAGALLGL